VQTPVVGSYRWKTKDLERLPEEPFLSYEIIDGELIVSRKPHLRHAAIIGTLCAQVYPAVRAKGGILLVEPGIVWSEEGEDNVAPDIAIVLPDRLHLATGRALSGTPNIVMEVVSEGSIEIDYVMKRALYARTGAQEYWIIDWLRQSIEVWTFIEQAAQVVTYTTGQTITTPLLPDVSISVEDLLS
jgi:Uma2 family endonuclease